MSEEKKKTVNRAVVPSVTIYHPNSRGKGSALAVRMIPAALGAVGYVQLEMARQRTVGDEKTFPTFNWGERIAVKLSPVETGEVLMCLRGITESLRDGAGFMHKGEGTSSKMTLAHMVDHVEGDMVIPRPCYRLQLWRHAEGAEANDCWICLTVEEAFTIETALTGAMPRLCFGR